MCGRRFARSDERRRHTKIHLKDRVRGGDKSAASKSVSGQATLNTGAEKPQAGTAVCVPQYQPAYHSSFHSSVMANNGPQMQANMQKMYGILPSNGNTGMLPINGETLSSNVYSKQEYQDPLYLYNQHVAHPQDLNLI